jgi:aconitase A
MASHRPPSPALQDSSQPFPNIDANAQMALLQFISAGLKTVQVPTSVHSDHLITAKNGDKLDLAEAERVNKEVYAFLESASAKVSRAVGDRRGFLGGE